MNIKTAQKRNINTNKTTKIVKGKKPINQKLSRLRDQKKNKNRRLSRPRRRPDLATKTTPTATADEIGAVRLAKGLLQAPFGKIPFLLLENPVSTFFLQTKRKQAVSFLQFGPAKNQRKITRKPTQEIPPKQVHRYDELLLDRKDKLKRQVKGSTFRLLSPRQKRGN